MKKENKRLRRWEEYMFSSSELCEGEKICGLFHEIGQDPSPVQILKAVVKGAHEIEVGREFYDELISLTMYGVEVHTKYKTVEQKV